MRYLVVAAAALASAAVPFTFTSNTPARAAEVNQNFAALDSSIAVVAADVAVLKAQVPATGGAAARVLTAENDGGQLEDGSVPSGSTAPYCAGGKCVYRLTAGPFVLTNTEQDAPASYVSSPDCPVYRYGLIAYFPAADDATAAQYAGSGGARWNFRSVSYEAVDVGLGSQATGVVMRYLVKAGEYLYAYPVPTEVLPADNPCNRNAAGSTSGHWSGYHPY